MITEDYVSFETAKLLKEKGFDWDCFQYWHEDDNELVHSQSMHPIQNISNPCFFGPAAPTLQMVMKWLRKVHHLEIYPFHEALQESNNWWFRIERHDKSCSLDEYESELEYNEYEDACEAAIKYCLKNLI